MGRLCGLLTVFKRVLLLLLLLLQLLLLSFVYPAIATWMDAARDELLRRSSFAVYFVAD